MEPYAGFRLFSSAEAAGNRFHSRYLEGSRKWHGDRGLHDVQRARAAEKSWRSVGTAAARKITGSPRTVPMSLPIRTSFPPMEAQPASELPAGSEWHYEPKWDGFRCLAFRDQRKVELLSKSQKPLTRYFPELVAELSLLKAKKFVLDGEIVISVDGKLSFDDLLMR